MIILAIGIGMGAIIFVVIGLVIALASWGITEFVTKFIAGGYVAKKMRLFHGSKHETAESPRQSSGSLDGMFDDIRSSVRISELRDENEQIRMENNELRDKIRIITNAYREILSSGIAGYDKRLLYNLHYSILERDIKDGDNVELLPGDDDSEYKRRI